MTADDPCNGEKCCCSCRWQANLFCHPSNPPGIGYGKVMQQFAYACINPEMSRPGERTTAVFSFGEHGICECFEGMK